MRSLFVTMIVTVMLLSQGETARAQSRSDLVHASLLANVSTIKPDWHVYWINPGDAGLPTRVKWILPAGYTASELRFPVPQHIDQPGGLVIYGYTDEVLLTSIITPPSMAGDSTSVPIAAKVDWLCCSEDCIPGKATLNLQLMQGDKSVPDNTDLFQQWQNRLPIIVPTSPPPLVLSDSTPQTQVVTTRIINDPKAIIPGAVDGLILTVGTPVVTPQGTTIPISAQILKGQTVSAKSLPILATWAAPDGKARPDNRWGVQINVPIVSGR
jgi:hypothetical protein